MFFRFLKKPNQGQTDKDFIKTVLSVSRELNGIRDVEKLLELILRRCIGIAGCDAGSIYTIERTKGEEQEQLAFRKSINLSKKINLSRFTVPVDTKTVVGKCVLSRKPIFVDRPPDNKEDKANFIDQQTGYRCLSMLSVPIYDVSARIIGVVQLINRKKEAAPLIKAEDFTRYVISFEPEDLEYAEIIAHQAGIALENAILTQQKEELFEGFVKASVKAIEQRDPTTSGHSFRVAKLTLRLAEAINYSDHFLFRQVSFSEKQLKEIKYASLLHDFGKLGVREQILVKEKKLFPWENKILEMRFELFRNALAFQALKEEWKPQKLHEEFTKLNQAFETIQKSNAPTVLEEGDFHKLTEFAQQQVSLFDGRKIPLLSGSELSALSVRRGSLTREEFAEIQSHVVHTYEFLSQIPWGEGLEGIPDIAGRHHEKLDGTGYPAQLSETEIPIQARMMTIVDIYDALTAADRPYKKAVSIPKALDILKMEVREGKCDQDIFRIFLESKCFENMDEKTELDLMFQAAG